LPPKAGMLAMTVKSFLRDNSRPIVFIPTYIGYERLMEGSTYVANYAVLIKKKKIFGKCCKQHARLKKSLAKCI
jgi:glycerol-3-phosphate O-acyltransferase